MNKPATTLRIAFVSPGLIIGLCVLLSAVLLGAVAVNVEAEDNTHGQHAHVEDVDVELASFEITPESPVLDRDEPLRDSSPAERARGEVTPHPAPSARSSSRIVWMEVTAYCPCKICCGPKAKGLTASGKHVSYNKGKFVAADTSVLPFGTKLIIPGYHNAASVEVIDRGGAIKGNKLDVYFPTHQQAKQWGRQWLAVTVVE